MSNERRAKWRHVTIALAVMVPLVAAPSIHAATPPPGIACPDLSDPVCAQAWKTAYIATVDPICQEFVGPLNKAVNAYGKNVDRQDRVARSGTLKAFVRQNTRTARSLMAFVRVHTSLTDQVSEWLPHPNDQATISAWLDGRKRAADFARSAVVGLRKFKYKKWVRNAKRSGATNDAARRAISGFGFQVCGKEPA